MMLPDDAVLQLFNIQFASLRRVNLRLSCTSTRPGGPMKEKLDVWLSLPIIIWDINASILMVKQVVFQVHK